LRKQADYNWENKLGQFQDGHATLLKIIDDGVHFEGFIEKAKHHAELESGKGRAGGGIWVD